MSEKIEKKRERDGGRSERVEEESDGWEEGNLYFFFIVYMYWWYMFRSIRKFKLDPNAKPFTPGSVSLPTTPVPSPVCRSIVSMTTHT